MANNSHVQMLRKSDKEWNEWLFSTEAPLNLEGHSFREEDCLNFASSRTVPGGDISNSSFFSSIHFESTHFTGDISFSRSRFHEHVVFENCKFSGNVSFNEANFDKGIKIKRCAFDGAASLAKSNIGDGNLEVIECNVAGEFSLTNIKAMKGLTISGSYQNTFNASGASVHGGVTRIEDTQFASVANFDTVTLVGKCRIQNSCFEGELSFRSASCQGSFLIAKSKISSIADFASCKFRADCAIRGTVFKDEGNFEATKFSRRSEFVECEFNKGYSLKNAEVNVAVDFLDCKFHRQFDCSGNSAFSGNFNGSIFHDIVVFHQREFVGPVSFINAKFESPPDFGAVSGSEYIVWEGTSFTTDALKGAALADKVEAEARLRVARLTARKIGAIDAEQQFHSLERKLVRDRLWRSNRLEGLSYVIVTGIFEIFSDFGRSINRPFSTFLIYNTFLLLMYFNISSRRFFDQDLWSFWISSLLPFSLSARSFTKDIVTSLFGPNPGFWVHFLSFSQGLVNAILLFLFFLALRNHLRLR